MTDNLKTRPWYFRIGVAAISVVLCPLVVVLLAVAVVIMFAAMIAMCVVLPCAMIVAPDWVEKITTKKEEPKKKTHYAAGFEDGRATCQRLFELYDLVKTMPLAFDGDGLVSDAMHDWLVHNYIGMRAIISNYEKEK